jgi:AraC family transcriptional regulator
MNTTNAIQQPTELQYRQRINRVMHYIQAHLDQPLRLNRLADIGHFSPYHFHRIFSAYVGETVAEYIRRLRLARAVRELIGTKLNITDIALQAGYETHSAFSKAFRQYVGVTPTELRTALPQQAAAILSQSALSTLRVVSSDCPSEPNSVMHLKPDLRVCPDQHVLYVRRHGMIHNDFTQAARSAFAALNAFLKAHQLQDQWQCCLGITPDDPSWVPEAACRYDAGVILCDGVHVAPGGDVAWQTLAGGRQAAFLHRGPYDTLWQTWNQAYRDWLPASSAYLRHAVPYEVYLNDPEVTGPEDLKTEICIPIQ